MVMGSIEGALWGDGQLCMMDVRRVKMEGSWTDESSPIERTGEKRRNEDDPRGGQSVSRRVGDMGNRM